MRPPPPRTTLTVPLFPDTALFRSVEGLDPFAEQLPHLVVEVALPVVPPVADEHVLERVGTVEHVNRVEADPQRSDAVVARGEIREEAQGVALDLRCASDERQPLRPGGDVEGCKRINRGDGHRFGSGSRSVGAFRRREGDRSEEHTSELQSLMRISYSVICLTKKIKQRQ